MPLKIYQRWTLAMKYVLKTCDPSSDCHFMSCQGFAHKSVSCKNQNSMNTHASAPRCRKSRSLGGHSDPTICCCNQTLKRWPDKHTQTRMHACQVHVCTQANTPSHTHCMGTGLAKYTHVVLNTHGASHVHSPDTHFERADCQHAGEQDTHTHTHTHTNTNAHTRTHGLQAQIAGSSLHAAPSTAAGTNQHNPPADRYGSLTATHTHTHTHAHARRDFSEPSQARTCSDRSILPINRSEQKVITRSYDYINSYSLFIWQL